MVSPELTAKPIALILPNAREKRLLEELSPRQKAYAIHWLRSNQKKWFWHIPVERLIRKAKANHP